MRYFEFIQLNKVIVVKYPLGETDKSAINACLESYGGNIIETIGPSIPEGKQITITSITRRQTGGDRYKVKVSADIGNAYRYRRRNLVDWAWDTIEGWIKKEQIRSKVDQGLLLSGGIFPVGRIEKVYSEIFVPEVPAMPPVRSMRMTVSHVIRGK